MTTPALQADALLSQRATALRLGAALAVAAAAAAAAQLRLPLPFTPVPITFQTAVVLFSGAALGTGWGTASMALYLAAGALGAPVFAGAEGGPAALFGPTGGYLLAFLLVPALVGRALSQGSGARRAFVVMLAASGVIFLWGMLQLSVALDLSVGRAFVLGVAPFVPGDLVKVAVAAAAFRGTRRWIARLRA